MLVEPQIGDAGPPHSHSHSHSHTHSLTHTHTPELELEQAGRRAGWWSGGLVWGSWGGRFYIYAVGLDLDWIGLGDWVIEDIDRGSGGVG